MNRSLPLPEQSAVGGRAVAPGCCWARAFQRPRLRTANRRRCAGPFPSFSRERAKLSPVSANRSTPSVSALSRCALIGDQLPRRQAWTALGIHGEPHFALEDVDVLVAPGLNVDAELGPLVDGDGFRRADREAAGLGAGQASRQAALGQKYAAIGFYTERCRTLQDQHDASWTADFDESRIEINLPARREFVTYC